MKFDDLEVVDGTVWVGPAGAEPPSDGKIPADWIPLHPPAKFVPFRDGHSAYTAHVAAFHEYAASARVHIRRPLWCALLGIPYRHPRPILHNGRKPR